MEDSRLINKEQAEQMKKDYDFDFFMEASAKTGLNAEDIFVEAGKLLYKEHSKYRKKNKRTGEKLKENGSADNSQIKKKKCC